MQKTGSIFIVSFLIIVIFNYLTVPILFSEDGMTTNAAKRYRPNFTINSCSQENFTDISIFDNSDFAWCATNYGWPGIGTSTDPYIIENYEIASILIRNVTYHFIFRNNIR